MYPVGQLVHQFFDWNLAELIEWDGTNMQIRCHDCQESIEFKAETNLESITCPHCGAEFSVVLDNETKSWRALFGGLLWEIVA